MFISTENSISYRRDSRTQAASAAFTAYLDLWAERSSLAQEARYGSGWLPYMYTPEMRKNPINELLGTEAKKATITL